MRSLLKLALAVSWVLTVVVMTARVWPATPAYAQGPQVRIFNSTSYPLTIDGQRAFGSPAIAAPGSRVCVTTTVGYLSDTERQVFVGWSTGSAAECTTFSVPGDYGVNYTHEVLLQVRSDVKKYRKSVWVARGEPVTLTVSKVVEEREGVQYAFEEWDTGQKPFSEENIVVPLRGTIVEVKWGKRFYLTVQDVDGTPAAESGWYRQGERVVLRTEAQIDRPSGKERLRFVQWESVGQTAIAIPNAQSATTVTSLDDTYKVRPRYRAEYLVTLQNPQGIFKREWVPQGGELMVEAAPILETVPDKERYTFKGWEGAALSSSKGLLVVNGPVEAKALYDREVMVKVVSPYGATGEGWYKAGSTATIQVPQHPGSVLFLKKVFNGFPGQTGSDPFLQVPVNGPVTITAAYRTQIDYKVLGIVIAVLLVAGVGYLLAQKPVQQILAHALQRHR